MKRLPAEIERASMEIIEAELRRRGFVSAPEDGNVIRRCIHASADFDYAENLRFTERAVQRAAEALRAGVPIVTDTNMALAGVSRPGLAKLKSEAFCFMAEPAVAARAREQGTTRAAAAMDLAAERYPGAVLAVGNAPTALFRIAEQIEAGLRPALVVGVPVGFVNVTESKERALHVCTSYDVPAIIALGRKGGSSIAAAILNALIYTAADLLEPEERGWK